MLILFNSRYARKKYWLLWLLDIYLIVLYG